MTDLKTLVTLSNRKMDLVLICLIFLLCCLQPKPPKTIKWKFGTVKTIRKVIHQSFPAAAKSRQSRGGKGR